MDAINEAAQSVIEVYKHHMAGGGLHVVIDDENALDENLDFVDGYINDPTYVAETCEDELAAERDCLAKLRALSEQDRYSAIELAHEIMN